MTRLSDAAWYDLTYTALQSDFNADELQRAAIEHLRAAEKAGGDEPASEDDAAQQAAALALAGLVEGQKAIRGAVERGGARSGSAAVAMASAAVAMARVRAAVEEANNPIRPRDSGWLMPYEDDERYTDKDSC